MVLQKYLAERLDLDGCDPLTPEAMAGPEPDHNESAAKSVSVLEMGLLNRRKLLGTGGTLVLRFPGLVGHAVDSLATLVF
jgi:hypothetical protein